MLKSKLTKSSTITKGSIKQQSLGSNDNAIRQQHLHASIGKESLNLDHSKLTHLDFEHSGHTGFAGIKFGTTAEWNSDPTYVADEGVLIVYTDYETKEEEGQIIYYPNFKIGDGNAYLIDKPFIGQLEREELNKHLADKVRHITQEEREFWNNKLNIDEPEGDLLRFTRN